MNDYVDSFNSEILKYLKNLSSIAILNVEFN